jgi:hypothetical protein
VFTGVVNDKQQSLHYTTLGHELCVTAKEHVAQAEWMKKAA